MAEDDGHGLNVRLFCVLCVSSHHGMLSFFTKRDSLLVRLVHGADTCIAKVQR